MGPSSRSDDSRWGRGVRRPQGDRGPTAPAAGEGECLGRSVAEGGPPEDDEHLGRYLPRCPVDRYFAASTYSLVQVFVRSIVLPFTFWLYVWSTLRTKSGAPAGIFPSGLNIGMLPVSAER